MARSTSASKRTTERDLRHARRSIQGEMPATVDFKVYNQKHLPGSPFVFTKNKGKTHNAIRRALHDLVVVQDKRFNKDEKKEKLLCRGALPAKYVWGSIQLAK